VKKLSEHDEQCMVMDWWSKQYKQHYGQLFAIPNSSHLAGNQRARWTKMAKMKAEGLRPGASDLFLAIPSGDYHGFFIEMKRTGGVPSNIKDNQHEFINDMREYGYKADVCFGYEAAINEIKDYLENGK